MAKRSALYVPPEEAEPKIREFFEACREDPGSPLDDKAFRKFLTQPSKRLRRFMKMIESEFLICFPGEYPDRTWTEFCNWVSDRSGKDQPNRLMAEKVHRQGDGCGFHFVVFGLSLPLLGIAFAALVNWLAGEEQRPIGLLVAFALPPLIAAGFWRRAFLHYERIRKARSGPE